MAQIQRYYALKGGLDLVTPPVDASPHTVGSVVNFVCDRNGGMRLVGGFERYDGQSKPSAAATSGEADTRRAAITTVDGSGPVRGVWVYGGDVYAARDTAGGAGAVYKATTSGWAASKTGLTGGGAYRFANYNFTGSGGAVKMYMVNGVDTAYQFDGTTWTSLATGMATDTPTHLAAHYNHLFLSFAGGSLQHSAIGDPTSWTPVTGAAELALGDEITGLVTNVGGILPIFTQNSTKILYGTSSSDWDLRNHSAESGALADTVQDMGQPIFLAARGVMSLSATDRYGDFTGASISQLVRPWLTQAKINSAVASIRLRADEQYWLLFSDGSGLVATFNAMKLTGISLIKFPFAPTCACSAVLADGSEVAYVGANDGYVYQINSGYSFDGANIEAYLTLRDNHFNSPDQNKRFFGVDVDADLESDIAFNITPQFEQGAVINETQTLSFAEGDNDWDSVFWDEASWGTLERNGGHIYTDATARAIGPQISYDNQGYAPFTITGLTYYLSPRSLKR